MADKRKQIVLDEAKLDLALKSLAIRLKANKVGPFGLVVCGGSALILTGLVARTTQDVDVVALMQGGILVAPDPIPAELAKAVHEVAETSIGHEDAASRI